MKKFVLALGLFVASFSLWAADYVAVGREGNIYDGANNKYITENQMGDQLKVVPGMVFSTSEHLPGWYKVEYSPGLHAYLPEQLLASNFNTPKPGSYKVTNNPSQTVSVQNDGANWTVSANGKTFKGNLKDNVVIFVDENNNPAFSLVDLGQGGIVISYDNAVTKFF
ncbi:MAG: hypothetical protein J1E82_00665 [Muribaculaceae bacterium]|nr:hypothetical protein [Muribaculaceae bacterium]